MSKLTILVDMDDVLENLLDAWVAWLNDRHRLSVAIEDVTDWDMTKVFPTLSKEEIFKPLLTDYFWHTVPAMTGAAETLKKLIADGHRILVVTSSHYATLKAKMEGCLFRHFPFLTS